MHDIAKNLNKMMQQLPTKMGVVGVQFVNNNFRNEGFDDGGLKKWDARGTLAQRSKGRSILVDTGQLRASIRILRKISPAAGRGASVIVGTDKPYAQAQNEGATIQVTPKQRRFFWAMYYKNRKAADVHYAYANATGKKAKKTKAKLFAASDAHDDAADIWKNMALAKEITIPKRQYIGQSQTLQKQLEQLVKDEITECFK
jgi:hypothetical protein